VASLKDFGGDGDNGRFLGGSGDMGIDKYDWNFLVGGRFA
jgi:hypothetical protein